MSAFDDANGKIGVQLFKQLVASRCGASRREVLTGPAFGTDTAVVDLGEQVLVTSSDPLSLIPALGMKASAWLSVHLMANDMATSGFAPQYAQFVLNLPVRLKRQDFDAYWGYIHQFCEELGVAITGGHTGQISGQDSTIAGGGTMFLVAPKSKVLTSNLAQPGDVIVVTKEAALSSTSILALSFPETVEQRCGQEVMRTGQSNFYRTSVMADTLEAVKVLAPHRELHALHDVTEGGVLGAIAEMAYASGCGFEVVKDQIPVSAAVRSIANLFGIDPLLSVGAGCMVMAVKPGYEQLLMTHLRGEGIDAAAVGYFMKDAAYRVSNGGNYEPFAFADQDPYWKAFFKACQSGWK